MGGSSVEGLKLSQEFALENTETGILLKHKSDQRPTGCCEVDFGSNESLSNLYIFRQFFGLSAPQRGYISLKDKELM